MIEQNVCDREVCHGRCMRTLGRKFLLVADERGLADNCYCCTERIML